MYNLNLAIWEMTKKCNLHCVHCISAADQTPRENELTTLEGLKLLEDLAELNCENIVLSGGEPFIHSDWGIFAQKIKNLGLNLYFISNGYAIDDDTLDVLYQLSPNSIALSLDGGSAEVHDAIRGKKGVFDHLVHVMKKAREMDLHISVASTMHKNNIDEIDNILKVLLECKIPVWQIQMAKPNGRMKKEDVLSEEQYYKLAEKIVELRKTYEDKIKIIEADCIGYYSKLSPGLDMQQWSGCQCGIQTLSIESNGNVKGCPNMITVEGNIRELSLKEIWNDHSKFSYNRRFQHSMLKGYCSECKYGNICRGGCGENPIDTAGNPYCLYKIETKGYD